MSSLNADPEKLAEVLEFVRRVNDKALIALQQVCIQMQLVQDVLALVLSEAFAVPAPVSSDPGLQNDITSSLHFIPSSDESGVLENESVLPDESWNFQSESTDMEPATTFADSQLVDESGICNETKPNLLQTTIDTSANQTACSGLSLKRTLEELLEERQTSSKRPKIQENFQGVLRSGLKRQKNVTVRFGVPLKRRKNILDDSTIISESEFDSTKISRKNDSEAASRPKRAREVSWSLLEPPLKIRAISDNAYGTISPRKVSFNDLNLNVGDSSGCNWLPVASLEKEDVPQCSRIKFKWNNSSEAPKDFEGFVFENRRNYIVLKHVSLEPGTLKTYCKKAEMKEVMILSNAQACLSADL